MVVRAVEHIKWGDWTSPAKLFIPFAAISEGAGTAQQSAEAGLGQGSPACGHAGDLE